MNGLLRPLVLFVALIGAGTAMAQKRPQQADPRPADAAPADSVRRAERQAGGEVIRAQRMQRDGKDVYRYRVLTSDGRVRVMQDDPQASAPGQQGPRRDPQDRRPRPNRDPQESDGQTDPI